jgi:uncharacterized repeat protein (TIGR01451 family)
MSETTSKKRKLSLPLVLAGGVSSLVLALGMSPTFSAFTAQIVNSTNTAGAGTLSMTETSGGKTCTSAVGTCTDINKYGGSTTMKPGDTATTTIIISNPGSVDAAQFTLTPTACTGTLCSHLKVTMVQDGIVTPAPVVNGIMASALTSAVTLNPVAHGGSTTIVITAQFVTTGTDAGDNALQGQSATQSMTWKFMS